MNVYKTFAHSVYVLFPGGCEGASKHKLLNKFYLTITCWKSKISTLKQHAESVYVEQKSNKITDLVFGSLLLNFSEF